ncbi:MAG: extracellular solute-binding protein [Alphaproteobacteria bacterium]
MRSLIAALFALTLAAFAVAPATGMAAKAETGGVVSLGLSIHGDLKYPPGFEHFDYADPDAPKGGEVRLWAFGTFDSLNPFIIKGVSAQGWQLTIATLLAGSEDEPASAYGYVAESVEVPPDRSWVIFNIRPEARFHDGSPITADDVIFSFEALTTKGQPFYRVYYGNVARVEKLGERKVKFSFIEGNNRELPFILGQFAILSKAFFETAEFGKTTLEPILGSGPYRVESVDPGRSITYRRVADYWGAELPVNRGQYNFDVVRYDYYRDATVALEAFKASEYDFRQENTAKVWATGYDFPALRQGLVVKEEIAHEQPQGMQAFIFNTRRPFFQDAKVRRALAQAFDFEWTNRALFHGAYTRTKTYFANSELASRGLPEGEERAILERYRGRVPDEVFTQTYAPPSSQVEGGIRTNLRKARRLLEDAGWVLRENRLVHEASGQLMEFEILLVNPLFERIAAPFRKNLERLGITARMRTVDTSQYEFRVENFDFDMIVGGWGQSLSPGNEQRDFWSSSAAETMGSRNSIGVKDPVVDELLELVISAPDRQSLVARTRALDRVLLWGHYVVPQWHITYFRIAYWNKLARPAITPKYQLGLFSWWVDPAKAERLRAGIGKTEAVAEPEEEAGGAPNTRLIVAAAATLVLALWIASRIRARRKG